VLYVRDLERLRCVFSLGAGIFAWGHGRGGENYMDYGIQLGRRFRALKAWVIWRSLGRAGVVARLREQIRLANLLGRLGSKRTIASSYSRNPAWALSVFDSWSRGALAARSHSGARRAGSIDRIDGINSDIVERLTRPVARISRKQNCVADSNENRPRQRAHHRRTSCARVGDHSGNGRCAVNGRSCTRPAPRNDCLGQPSVSS